jgi:hypothetical protein|tara:strand:+ start:4538 stop:6292 length:1755 start_codon:yes stop_codon:yes gene_type:complete
MATANLGITLPTVGGSTDTWGGTLNTGITAIDALFSVSGTDVTMSDIKFNSIGLQETGAGTDTVKIQAPSAVTQHTLTMPGAVPSANEVLTASDGSGTLSWAAPTVGDITSVVAGAGMTGGGTSGAVTLNVIGTADKITVSADAVTIASGYVGQSSITTLGTIGTGVWNGTAITGAYIDPTSSPLANTKIWIGSASNVAAEFALSGNATMTAGGVVTVSTAAACSGLAATATALATARAINGVDFDGTAPITVTAAAGTLTGTTLKSTVVTSSLTAVGTIATGVWNGTKVASAYLDDDTAHLSGTQTFSGAKTFSAALVASSTLGVGMAAARDMSVASGGTASTLQVSNSTAGTGAGDGVMLQSNGLTAVLGNQESGDFSFFTNNNAGFILRTATLNVDFIAGITVAEDVTMATTKKLYLDGGTHSYLTESEADTVDIFAGGEKTASWTTGAVYFPKAYSSTSGSAANVIVGSNGGLNRSTSSLRYKADVVDYELDRAQSLIAALEPITYRHKEEDHHHLGFIAEAVHPHEPLLVVLNEDGEPEALEYDRLAVPLTAVVQGQMAEIAALTDRIAALEASASDGV